MEPPTGYLKNNSLLEMQQKDKIQKLKMLFIPLIGRFCPAQ